MINEINDYIGGLMNIDNYWTDWLFLFIIGWLLGQLHMQTYWMITTLTRIYSFHGICMGESSENRWNTTIMDN